MNALLMDKDLELTQGYITARLGMDLPSTNVEHMKVFLQKKVAEYGTDCFNYLKRLDTDYDEYCCFVDAVTINETYFFREEKHFTVLKDIILPELSSKKSEISVWSAACSTGEEAISAYLLLSSYFSGRKNFSVTGSDINQGVIDAFKRGIYTKNSFREDGKLFHHLVKNCGTEKSRFFEIYPDIINKIDKYVLNLFDYDSGFFKEKFDIILLRNTLIYFNTEHKKRIIESIIRNLNPGGYVILSSTEMPLISHSELKLIEMAGTYVFKKKSPEDKKQEEIVTQKLINIVEHEEDDKKVSENDNRFIEAADFRQILEYADNKINNRIFSLPNNPNYNAAMVLLKIIYSINNSDLDKSVLLLEKLVLMTGENPLTIYINGYIMLMKNNRPAALDYFKKTLDCSPDFWPASFFASSILKSSNSYELKKYLTICIAGIEKYITAGSYLYQVLLEGFNGKYFLRICEQWLKE